MVPLAELGVADGQRGAVGDKQPAPIGSQVSADHSTKGHQNGSRLVDLGPSPEATVLTQEARLQIRAAIDSLPPTQRMVITMRDLEGCSSEEV
jgi:DNA-directed RNA polymerase specialized sigma24 family protein